jgi:hypothetical protein
MTSDTKRQSNVGWRGLILRQPLATDSCRGFGARFVMKKAD